MQKSFKNKFSWPNHPLISCIAYVILLFVEFKLCRLCPLIVLTLSFSCVSFDFLLCEIQIVLTLAFCCVHFDFFNFCRLCPSIVLTLAFYCVDFKWHIKLGGDELGKDTGIRVQEGGEDGKEDGWENASFQKGDVSWVESGGIWENTTGGQVDGPFVWETTVSFLIICNKPTTKDLFRNKAMCSVLTSLDTLSLRYTWKNIWHS